ncbi:MAG: hypothetical protein ACRDJI_03150 [Actinomycetota bacterium]
MIVSEDPEFIVALDHLMRSRGAEVVGCIEPADARWLPRGAGIAIIDAPPSGAFVTHGECPPRPGHEVPAGRFAEELAARHPDVMVVVCNVNEGAGGPSGGVACVENREVVVDLLAAVAG